MNTADTRIVEASNLNVGDIIVDKHLSGMPNALITYINEAIGAPGYLLVGLEHADEGSDIRVYAESEKVEVLTNQRPIQREQCPVCKGYNVGRSGIPNPDPTFVRVINWCKDCRSKWVVEYTRVKHTVLSIRGNRTYKVPKV